MIKGGLMWHKDIVGIGSFDEFHNVVRAITV